MPLLNIQDIIKRVITQYFILQYGCHVNEISQHGPGIPNVLVQKFDNGKKNLMKFNTYWEVLVVAQLTRTLASKCRSTLSLVSYSKER
jgi:hypothetical protein